MEYYIFVIIYIIAAFIHPFQSIAVSTNITTVNITTMNPVMMNTTAMNITMVNTTTMTPTTMSTTSMDPTTATTTTTTRSPESFVSIHPRRCPKEFCNGKPPHGNFKLIINSVLLPNHYLACSGGFAYCMPCAPASPKLVYNEKCDKCLFPHDSSNYLCHRRTTSNCPTNKAQNDDYCMTRGGYDFSGNLAAYGDDSQYYSTYISCWYGKFVKCMSCPQGLVFYEKVDWQGNYYQYGHCGYPRK